MRSSKSRSRGNKNRNNNRPTGGNIINRVFDSSGPDGKVRGTPQQIIEKYTQLHRDAQLSNDRVNAENFAQHAEHYLRLLAEAQREVDKQREQQEEQNRERQAERDRQIQADRERQAERDREREANRERERQNQEKAAERKGRTDGDADSADQQGQSDDRSDSGDGAEARKSRQSVREREKAERLRAQEEAFNGPTPSMLLDPGSSDQPDLAADDGPGLVETPESKPKPRAPRARKPRAPKKTAEAGSDAPDTASGSEAAG